MRLSKMVAGLVGLALSAPAYSLISLHVISPHDFPALDLRLGQPDLVLVVLGLSVLAGAAVYRFLKAR